jgi:hypothetical protein
VGSPAHLFSELFAQSAGVQMLHVPYGRSPALTDLIGGRLSLMWEPADGWKINPQITAQRQISRGYFGFDPKVGDLEVHDYGPTRNDDKWYQAQMTVNGHIGDFELVSATGYFRRNIKLLNDYTYYTVAYDGFGTGYENYLQFFGASGCTGTGASLKCTQLINPTQFYRGNRNDRIFTQELRLKTPSSWPFDVTVGGFYQIQKNEINDDYSTEGLDKVIGYTESGGGDRADFATSFGRPTSAGGSMILGSPAVKRDAFYTTEQDRRVRDAAIFAEGHYNITPNLKITGGLRYFWTDLQVIGFAGVAGSARSLVTTLCMLNPAAFHRPDASGYVFWAEQLLALDAINPQVAARLARVMDRWTELAEPWRSAAREAIARVAAKTDLSDDVREIVTRALEGN